MGMVTETSATFDNSKANREAAIDQDVLDVEDSWLRSWLRWCPTSMALLRKAEQRILSHIKTPFWGRFVDVGQTVGKTENKVWTLGFNEKSDKTPLVLIHGFASGVGLWCLNLDTFAARRPVYAFDLLGFGRSSRPTFSRDALAAERELILSIEEWRKKVGLEKFVLLGHSMGGFLASSYALQYPERVSHLILADPWGFPEQPADISTKYQIPFWVKGIAYLLQPFNPLWIVRAVGPWGPRVIQRTRPDIIKKFSGLVEDSGSAIPEYIYHCNAQNPTGEGAFHAMMANFGWAKFPMINRIVALKQSVPVTFIYGARSWVDHLPGEQFKNMRPDSYVNIQIIHNAGHHVYADRSDVFNEIVLNACELVDVGFSAKIPLNISSSALNPTEEENRIHEQQEELSATPVGTMQATETTSTP